MLMRSLLLTLAVLVALPASAQGAQYRAQTGTFALTDCRIETVTNGVIERGTVVIESRPSARPAPRQEPSRCPVLAAPFTLG